MTPPDTPKRTARNDTSRTWVIKENASKNKNIRGVTRKGSELTNGMNQENGGDEEMETSDQITPPDAMPVSRHLNYLQKSHLYQAFEALKSYPNDLQMRHAANDMNVEYEAVVEYFEDLKRRNGIPDPFDPFAYRDKVIGTTDSSNKSNNNQFIPNPWTQRPSGINNSSFKLNASPQPRAQKRASNAAPDFASKFRRQDPEPME
ncbi:hypothetical protein CAEBREN_04648 [Caenorhabditis brenneri]|uniref:Uncharacterized protein n=1 Tax=Caenorhabditis brenneri TaxID=135651 RepID=G0NC70_CAEBE|nr:hypothetical protein CAEBREN_04648 [Caenorhabditis brenneri]